MKKIYLVFLTALCLSALSLSSCTKDSGELDVAHYSPTSFRAPPELASRPTLDGNYNVIWSEGDEIAVFGITDSENYEGQIFTLSEGAGTTDGLFSGTLDKEYADYYAFYPLSMYDAMYVSGKYKIELPTSAVFTEQNFVKDANPMIAYGTETGGLSFKNLCGIVEFRIAGSGTINNIQVVSGDGQPIAGAFYADPRTLELSPAVGEGDYNHMHIYASLENPIELSQTPRSIYAILPAGSYSNLSIRTIDDSGTLTTRTAQNDITVTRSHIVPVSQFSHTERTVPYLSIHYLEEESDFNHSVIRFSANNVSSGFHYCCLSYTDYENNVASGKSDFEILAENASTHNNQSVNFRFNTIDGPEFTSVYDPYGKYVALGVPFDANGEYEQTNVSKLVFSCKRIPFTDEISVSIDGEPEITENSISLNIRQNTSWDQYKVLYDYCEKEDYDNLTDIKKQLFALSRIPYGFTSGQDIYNISLDYLYPNKEYIIAFSATDGIKAGGSSNYFLRYANVQTYAFRTPAHTPSDATVSFTAENVSDWSATVRMQPSEGVTKIKYLLAIEQSDEYTADYVALHGNEVMFDETSPIIEFDGLKEETAYYLYGVAYNAKDSYGHVSAPLALTTTPLIPVQDKRYSEFLGEYTMSITYSGHGDTSRDVTIEQGVEGKTFLVKGLIHTSVTDRYGFDDTVTATYKDGKIRFNCQTLKSHGSLPDDVRILVFNSRYMWYNPDFGLESTYNNGVVRPFGIFNGMEWRGLLFEINNSNIDFYDNITLTKKGVVIPVIGSYTMKDSATGSENTFTVAPGQGNGQYLVSSFGLDGSDDLQWYASYDENAGTFTVSGQVVGWENYTSLFGYHGFYTYGNYHPCWFSYAGDGSTGVNLPCIFAVDSDTKKISALTTNLQVSGFDGNGNNLGWFVRFLTESTTVAVASAAASVSAAGKAAMPTVKQSSMPLGAKAKAVDAPRKSSGNKEIRNYADVIGR